MGGFSMKKTIISVLLIFAIISSLTGCSCIGASISDGSTLYKYQDVKDVLIRFHVIANSDSEEDQSLKLKVKDSIINYLYPILKNSESLDSARNIILQNQSQILSLTEKVIKEQGYSYTAKVDLTKDNFPDKSYGKITLPAGEYEALKIVIGKGEGKNWWCVMFPPLCFIDVTEGTVEDEESKEELDYQIEKSKEDSSEEPEIKFKILEIIDNLTKTPVD